LSAQKAAKYRHFVSGANRDRTGDLLLANLRTWDPRSPHPLGLSVASQLALLRSRERGGVAVVADIPVEPDDPQLAVALKDEAQVTTMMPTTLPPLSRSTA
jgi:hypothetical protein